MAIVSKPSLTALGTNFSVSRGLFKQVTLRSAKAAILVNAYLTTADQLYRQTYNVILFIPSILLAVEC